VCSTIGTHLLISVSKLSLNLDLPCLQATIVVIFSIIVLDRLFELVFQAKEVALPTRLFEKLRGGSDDRREQINCNLRKPTIDSDAERSHSWSSAPSWKGGIGATLSRVRIPPSPP
jgi:hypothetical protein